MNPDLFRFLRYCEERGIELKPCAVDEDRIRIYTNARRVSDHFELAASGSTFEEAALALACKMQGYEITITKTVHARESIPANTFVIHQSPYSIGQRLYIRDRNEYGTFTEECDNAQRRAAKKSTVFVDFGLECGPIEMQRDRVEVA